MGGTGVEREIKLAVPEQYRLPDLTDLERGLTMTPLETQHLEARYLDTDDGALLAVGATLRRRTGEGPTRWTLKLPSAAPNGDVLTRREVEVVDDGDALPGALADALLPFVEVATLVDVARLRTERRRWNVSFRDRSLGELADDTVDGVCPGHPAVRFREIELELSDEAPDPIVAEVAASLRLAGASDADPTPKLARVLRMAAGER